MKFFLGWVACITLSLLALAGCQTAAPPGANFTDDLGRSVQISRPPHRIISLSPSNTEIVYALGLEDKLIGVTTYDNYPEAVKDKLRVSEYSNIDIEKIIALKPDLVLADSIQKNGAVPALEKLGVTVLVINPETLEGTIKDIEMLGRVGNQTAAAAALAANLQNRLKIVTDKTAKLTPAETPPVFFLTWYDPLWTAGANTVINELMTKAGGANIAADLNGHNQMDLETVIHRNPRIIFVMSSMGDRNASLNYIKTEPRFQATEALKNNRVYTVDSDIFGRTTPRLVDGLEIMAKLIHPELFK